MNNSKTEVWDAGDIILMDAQLWKLKRPESDEDSADSPEALIAENLLSSLNVLITPDELTKSGAEKIQSLLLRPIIHTEDGKMMTGRMLTFQKPYGWQWYSA